MQSKHKCAALHSPAPCKWLSRDRIHGLNLEKFFFILPTYVINHLIIQFQLKGKISKEKGKVCKVPQTGKRLAD